MHVSEITIYPVKSLKGFSVQTAEVTSTGLKYDRHWMLVQPDGTFMTQRTHPQMALVETEIDNDTLVLSCFGMEPHTVQSIDESSATISTDVWGDKVTARVHDEATNDWLSQAIGTDCKLVCFPDDEIRHCDPDYSQERDHTEFADAYPVLVLSQASLDLLNQKLQQPVGINRFRPNLVVAGCEAHDEDQWNSIRIGGLMLRNGVPCARCSVPTVDPDAGILAGPEPVHTLSSYRRRDGEIYFGMTFIPDSDGSITVGSAISV